MNSNFDILNDEICLPIDWNRNLLPILSYKHAMMPQDDLFLSHDNNNEICENEKIWTFLPHILLSENKAFGTIDSRTFCIWGSESSPQIDMSLAQDTTRAHKWKKSEPAIDKLNIDDKIQSLMDLLSMPKTSSNNVLIHRSTKMKISRRRLRGSRSQYIGVTLNRNSWQALISVNQK